jgi:undecaprenyl-phosphate 4-deoxy-4-formamido-L-arabinose transferase
MRNYGQHNALLAGIREARYETVVTLDDDLQNPPEEIPRLLAQLDEGDDLVYGIPRQREQGFWRRAATRLAGRALRIAIGTDAANDVSAYRAFRARLRAAFADFSGPYVSIDVLLGWATSRIGSVVVEHHPRAAGESNYGFLRLVRHAFNVLTGFSTRPLRLASLIGLATIVFGVAVLIDVIVRFFTSGREVPGFAFLASIIAIFAGAQLLSLGLIGEYLARVHMRVMERPAYAVRERVGAGVETSGHAG